MCVLIEDNTAIRLLTSNRFASNLRHAENSTLQKPTPFYPAAAGAVGAALGDEATIVRVPLQTLPLEPCAATGSRLEAEGSAAGRTSGTLPKSQQELRGESAMFHSSAFPHWSGDYRTGNCKLMAGC